MSSGKKKVKGKNNKAKNNKGSNRPPAANSSDAKVTPAFKSVGLTEYTAAAAGILICLMTAFMLIADLFTDDPQSQYDLYPAVFKAVNACIVAAGVVCLGMMAYRNHNEVSKKKVKSRKRSRGRNGAGSNYLVTWLQTERYWIYFSLFLLCMLISTCINGLDTKAIHGLPYRNIGVFHLAAFIIFYMGASACIRTEKMRRLVLLAFSAVADLIAVSALYDIYIDDIVSYHAKKELSAIFFNGNHYGYFLTMAVLVGIGLAIYTDGWQMMTGAVTALINLLVLGLNHSLGCIIAVLLVTLIAAIIILIREPHRRRRVGYIISAAITIFAAALICLPEVRSEFAGLARDAGRILSGSAKGSEGHNRLKVWTKTWKYIMEKPLFGYGCEGISERLYIASAISNPHNEILTYAAYYGIPAAIAYTAGIISVLIRSFRSKIHKTDAGVRIACLAASGYFVSSLTGVAMFYLTPLFFVFMGIGISEGN